MRAKEIAKRIVHHVFAWVLLLVLGIAAILGGVAIVASGYRNTFIIWPSDGDGIANVVLFLVTLSVGFGMFLIRGVSYGVWTLSPGWVLWTLTYALVLLAFGEVGLGAFLVGQLALYACARVAMKRRNGA